MTARARCKRFTVSLVAGRHSVLSLTASDVLEAEEDAAEQLGVTTRALFARELGPVRPSRRTNASANRQL